MEQSIAKGAGFGRMVCGRSVVSAVSAAQEAVQDAWPSHCTIRS